ncbi:hypothetical protein DXG01_006998 [Tephrocybe rancida]|nr:hypothetical protein DXG01_006998 [Tephrocybe rancida]
MIVFTSYPVPPNESYDASRTHHPDVSEDILMDIEDEDPFESGGSKLTYPGETLTSSHAYMRCVHSKVKQRRRSFARKRAWYICGQRRSHRFRSGHHRASKQVGNCPCHPHERRKLESDELQMRTFFEEGDLLVAEVQAFFSDGAMSLHTRSLKYGKLRNGQLVVVPPILVRRLKSHFIALPCGVDLILGLNGYIWVSKHVKESDQEGEEGFDAEAVYSNLNDRIDESTRTAISRVTNIIRVLASHFVPLTDMLLLDAYEWTVEQDGGAKDLLQEDVGDVLVATVTARL